MTKASESNPGQTETKDGSGRNQQQAKPLTDPAGGKRALANEKTNGGAHPAHVKNR